jgi:dihydrofolate reductase
MAKLIYFTPTSLDGFIADERGDYDWSAPDDEAMAFMNELLRPVGLYLYGRKTYETMEVWQAPDVIPNLSPEMRAFAPIWQAADKIVYSKTLKAVSTPKTRLERDFDPRALRDLPRDTTVGGPTLAAQALRAGIVDEVQLLVVPVLRGGGRRVLPGDVRVKLDLLDERRFANGWVYLRYRARG